MEFFKKYRKHIGLALAVLLLMGASYFACKLYWRSRGPARVRDLQAKMFDPNNGLDRDQRREIGRQLGAEMQNLSDSQRGQMGKERTQQMMAPIRKYFQLSDSEKAAYLDEQIDKEEEMMKRMREWRAQQGDQGGGGNRPGRGRNNGGGDNQGGGGGNQGGGNQGGGDSNVPPPPPNQGGNQGGGGGGGPPPPGADNQGGGGPARNAGGQGDRSQRRKQSLDYSSPQDRQNWSQYSQDYQNRRQQRGLGPSSFGGFGGGGFGGGRRGG